MRPFSIGLTFLLTATFCTQACKDDFRSCDKTLSCPPSGDGDGDGEVGGFGGGSGGTPPLGGAGGTVEQPEPESGLTISAPEWVRVYRGGETTFEVTVSREGGAEGELSLEFGELPEGVEVLAEPSEEPDQFSVVLTSSGASELGGPFPVPIAVFLTDEPVVEAEATLSLAIAGDPGSLDETFGDGDGYVTIDINSGKSDVVSKLNVDGEHRLVVAGRTAGNPDPDTGWVFRLTAQGLQDLTFPVKTVAPVGTVSSVKDATLLGNDVILAASAGGTWFLRRYKDTGTVDPEFGSSGDFLLQEEPRDIASRGGDIVVGSQTSLRVISGLGQIDPSFAAATVAGLSCLAVDRNGKVLWGGGSSSPRYEFYRFDQVGSVDEEFGDLGIAEYPAPESTAHLLSALFAGQTGTITAVVHDTSLGFIDGEVALIRWNEDGSLVPTYGSGGKALALSEGYYLFADLLPNDEILVGSWGNQAGHVAKFSASGARDDEFSEALETTLLSVFSGEFPSKTAVDDNLGRVFLSDTVDGEIVIASIWL